LMGPFPPSSKQHRFLLVITDYFSKFTLLFPLRQATAQAIVRHTEDTFLMFGVPQFVRSDNGTQYKSTQYQTLLKKYEATPLYNANYHPQVNPTERVNRVMKTMIASYVKDNHRNWDRNLSQLGCAIRTATHEVTGYTPAFLNFGREIALSGRCYGQVHPEAETEINGREEWASKLEGLPEIFKDVETRLQRAYDTNKRVYDLRRRHVEYNVGQRVWKRNFVLSDASRYFTSKLAPKFAGPYTIRKKISPLVYDLVQDNGKSIGNWHVKDLKATNEEEEPNEN
jgi:Integrase core domain